ncbi:ATP-dependent Lon protease [Ornithobacterium rhinotracheale]|uniref:ATP-dependent Lon protease n=1 Tax=Ornithobacterium rhinotracheale TaxID=28251 RepID=UPI001FF43FF5|nr:ATP-dependent Lon protease [Ornithobacterium rhinotracheale]MCK0201389.1 ATP-dependent Lon protease [Ornithobacterium rhinotracheale]
MKKRIHIAVEHRKILQSEFNVSDQCVRNALRYNTFGEQPEAIRKRAKELLKEEAKKVELI